MNYMQKMGIDPNTVDGLVKIMNMRYIGCMDIPDTIGQRKDECKKTSCAICMAKRLLAEVPTKKVKRWELYDGNMVKALLDHNIRCRKGCEDGVNCRECFASWLMEEVEDK